MDKLNEILALWPFAVIFLSLIFVRMIITTFHEAGHAITIVILTKQPVTVYLGSYGDRQMSAHIAFGKFDVWIIKNILKWKGGLCVPHATSVSSRHKFMYILAGPVASLLLALILIALYFAYRPEGYYAAFLFIFCVAAGLSFLYNISPAYAAVITGKGNLTYNDGAQLKMLLDHKKLPSEYNDAIVHLNTGHYDEALTILDRIIGGGTKNPEVYRMAVAANIELKNYVRADQLQRQQVKKIGNLNSHDRINMALLKTMLGRYEEAVRYYKHLLQSDGDNKFNLNNLGFTLTLMNRFDEAIIYLDKAIKLDDEFAQPYCNRSYAGLMLGQIEEGKADNDRSFQLGGDDSYVHRNAGIYSFAKDRYKLALEQFEKAKEMDPDTFFIDKWIIQANNRLIDEENNA